MKEICLILKSITRAFMTKLGLMDAEIPPKVINIAYKSWYFCSVFAFIPENDSFSPNKLLLLIYLHNYTIYIFIDISSGQKGLNTQQKTLTTQNREKHTKNKFLKQK